MRLRLLRHATLVLEIAGTRVLVDPMLGPAGSQPPVANTANPRPNPLVDLPVAAGDAVDGVHAAIVSHLHGDHVDRAGLAALAGVPLYAQPGDAAALPGQVTEIADEAEIGAVRVRRTGGRHGTGDIGAAMGHVSGFVFSAEGEPTLYVAGDTVWCDEVRDAIAAHRPDVIVVNAGAARFLEGDPITMDVPDVLAVCEAAPEAVVVAVHMEAVNHCGLLRDDLRTAVDAAGVGERVVIPADGETLRLAFD
ncbi:MAG: MBL fold metallo-hydrolase [Thermoleophilia bacterium]